MAVIIMRDYEGGDH